MSAKKIKKRSINNTQIQRPTIEKETGVLPLQICFWISVLIIFMVPFVYYKNNFMMYIIPKSLWLKCTVSVILTFWVLYMLTSKQFKLIWDKSRPLGSPLLVFALVCCISTIFSNDPWMSLVGVYERHFGLHGILCCVILYFILVSSLKKENNLFFLLSSLVIAGLLISLYAILQITGLDFFKIDWFLTKPGSFLGNSNFLGQYLAPIFPMSVFLGLYHKKKLIKILFFIAASIILTGIIISQCRGAWTAVFISVFSTLIILLSTGSNFLNINRIIKLLIFSCLLFFIAFGVTSSVLVKHKMIIPFGIIAIITICVYYWWIRTLTLIETTVKEKLLFILLPGTLGIFSTAILFSRCTGFPVIAQYFSIFDFTHSTRFYLWRDSFYVIKQHFLLGSGIETYRIAFMPYKAKALELLDPITNHDNPHNNALYYWASTGIFGLLSYIWIFVTVIKRNLTLFYKHNLEKKDIILCLLFLSTFFSYYTWSIAGFDSLATYSSLMAIFAAFNIWSNKFIKVKSIKKTYISVTTATILIILVPLSVIGAFQVYKFTKADYYYIQALQNRKIWIDNPDNVLALRNYDATHYYMGKAIELNPKESLYQLDIATLYSSMAGRNINNVQQRMNLINLAFNYIEPAKKHPWAIENIYIATMNLKILSGDLRAASVEAENVLRHSPHLWEVRKKLGLIYLRLGDKEKARYNLIYAKEVFHWPYPQPDIEEALKSIDG